MCISVLSLIFQLIPIWKFTILCNPSCKWSKNYCGCPSPLWPQWPHDRLQSLSCQNFFFFLATLDWAEPRLASQTVARGATTSSSSTVWFRHSSMTGDHFPDQEMVTDHWWQVFTCLNQPVEEEEEMNRCSSCSLTLNAAQLDRQALSLVSNLKCYIDCETTSY